MPDREERAVLKLVQDDGGLVGGTRLPEARATPAWPGEGATMLGRRTLLVGFVLKTDWWKVFPWSSDFQPFPSHDTHKRIIKVLWHATKYIIFFADLTNR